MLTIRTSIDIFSAEKCKVTFGLKYTNKRSIDSIKSLATRGCGFEPRLLHTFRRVPKLRSKKIMGRTDFSDQFRKIIYHKPIGMIEMSCDSACLVINPITVGNFAALFNCTPVDQTSDSLMAPT